MLSPDQGYTGLNLTGFLPAKLLRYPHTKGLGNQDMMVHRMKTQPRSTETGEDLRIFPWYTDSRYLSIRKYILSAFVNWADTTKNQRTDTQVLTCILATDIIHSVLLLFWDVWLKNKTLRRIEGKADGNCQVHTMLAPSWGEGAELLHCSHRKPWWEPDCRFSI